MPKTKPVAKRATARRTKKPTWTQQHLEVKKLIEDELAGLLQYLRSIHYLGVFMMLASIASLLYGISILFQRDHAAVIAFLVIIVTSLGVLIMSLWALRPWVLPRFLLPLNLNELDLTQLMKLFEDPEEYLRLLKTHTQVLTETFLIPKLRRLRLAIAMFVFGMSVAIVLAIALP